MGVADVLMSPAKLFYAPAGESEPDPNSVGYGDAWGGNWVNAGLTLQPLAVKYSREIAKIDVEQATLPIRGQIDGETVSAETKLAEFTAANLKLGFGGVTSTQVADATHVEMEELKAGGAVDLPVYAFGFEGLYQKDDGTKYPVRVFFYRASAALNGDLQFSKKDAVGIPLAITAWADTSKPAGQQIIHIQKVTGPHT